MKLTRTAAAVTVALVVSSASAQQTAAVGPASVKQSAIVGIPADATDEWTLAYGGRLYDTWWTVLGEPAPVTTGARVLIFPGAAALWPYVLVRWLKSSR